MTDWQKIPFTMSRTLKATALGTVLFAAPALLPMLPAVQDSDARGFFSVAEAQQKEKKKEQKTRKTPAIRAKTFKKLSAAQELAEENKFAEAEAVLDEVKAKADSLNSYELAQMYNFYAFIHYAAEKYDAAINDYRQVLKQENIPLALELSAHYALAQLFFVTEDYRSAVKEMNAWFALADNPGATSYVLLGQAYYQIKDFDPAIKSIEKAIAIYQEKGKVAKENWYLLLRVMYHEKGNLKKVREIVETLVDLYPKKEYWLQLSGIYGEQKKPYDQLTMMDVAYIQGLLDREGEFLNLSYMYLGQDVPYKAAKILEKSIADGAVEGNVKNLETLANAWRASQEIEKSIPVLEKAARLSDDGELFARLGQLYLDNDEYEKAVKAIRQGLKKGGVKRKDIANVVLGMSLFNLDRLGEAEKAFMQASKADKRSRKMANQWLNYLTKERERRKKLKEGLYNARG